MVNWALARTKWGRRLVLAGLATATGVAADPWADAVIAYDAGGAGGPFLDPQTALGAPERFTGELTDSPGVVTPFNGAFGVDEVVTVGAGGSLTVRFDEPITNDPSHLYGVDLIIFGNGFFGIDSFPDGVVSGLFGEGPFTVSVSADGSNFVPLTGQFNDALFPTLGYLDLASPFETEPGSVLSDFTRPVDPALTYADFAGLSFAQVVALYDGSGGGLPLDIGPSGLASVTHVRVDVLGGEPEFDAFVAVPEPSALVLLGLAGFVALRRGSTAPRR